MNVPVYIVTGFLGSGKTKFITDMLTDEGFSEGERTLLLCCEEGEEEYDPEVLKKCNTTLVSLDEVKQIAGKRLIRMNREHQPERVIIEYNATWLMENLYAAEKPDSWTLAQIIDIVDATTFELYLKNMRRYMADGLKEADLVIFNRCFPDTRKSPWRRAVKGLNGGARIFFERRAGAPGPLRRQAHPRARARLPHGRHAQELLRFRPPRDDLLRLGHRRHRLPVPVQGPAAEDERLDLRGREGGKEL